MRTFSKNGSFLLLGMALLLSNAIKAQDSTFVNQWGMKFIKVNAGSMVVGRFHPTVSAFGFVGPKAGLPEVAPATLQKAEQMATAAATEGFSITLQHAYYLGQYEVTQEQYQAVMGRNPAVFNAARVGAEAPRHPVENISWEMAQAFIDTLNRREKSGVRYRLPTEFEWEYAARAGAADDIAWNDIWAMAVIATQTTRPVGSKKPNAWGFYDMLGNVWEWVADYYNEKIFADPVPPATGTTHVLKGAPFYGDVKNATYFSHAGGPGSGYDTGVRILAEKK